MKSWENLAREIFAAGKVKWKEPQDYEARRRYYSEEVPQTLHRIVSERKFLPRYDALVVDEAQDHDTSFPNGKPGTDGAGWWDVYLKQLHEGAGAHIAAFFDPGQRPLFRAADAFDVARLRRHLSGPSHVRLANALRYTQPVFQFLKGLRSDATTPLVNELRHREVLPDGPDVELHAVKPEKLASKVGDIVSEWIAGGFCRADDILILSPRSAKARSGLAKTSTIGAWKLVEHESKQPGEISYLSVNKAKGLDSLAVILIDVLPFDELSDGQDQMDYFMGASRARQLLAVVQGNR